MHHFHWPIFLCTTLCYGMTIGFLFWWGEKIHHGIARSQHFRRQRLLKRKLAEEEWAGVPQTALSQAQPAGPPQPTDGSVSQADVPEEEKPRLTAAVEEEPRQGLWQTIKARWER